MEKMHLIIACCEKSLAKLSLPFEVLPVRKHHTCFSFMSDRHSTNFKFTCCLAKASTWMKSSCFKNWAQKDAMKFCWHVLHKVAWIHAHLGDDKTHLWWWLFLLGFSRVCRSEEALCRSTGMTFCWSWDLLLWEMLWTFLLLKACWG